MARVIVFHKLKDFHAWKPAYDADAERRNSVGLKQVSLEQGRIDPNTCIIEWEIDNPAVIEGMMGDPELRTKMQEAGVEEMDYYVV